MLFFISGFSAEKGAGKTKNTAKARLGAYLC